MTKEPEDLQIVIGTEEQRFWEEAKKNTLKEIENAKRTILMDEHLLILIQKRIDEEQETLKS